MELWVGRLGARHTDVKQLRAPDRVRNDSSVGLPAVLVLRRCWDATVIEFSRSLLESYHTAS